MYAIVINVEHEHYKFTQKQASHIETLGHVTISILSTRR